MDTPNLGRYEAAWEAVFLRRVKPVTAGRTACNVTGERDLPCYVEILVIQKYLSLFL